MKVKYIGTSFGADGLTNGQVYKCLAVEGDFLRIIDNSGEDYLYPTNNPASLSGGNGRWVIVADSDRILQSALHMYLEAV